MTTAKDKNANQRRSEHVKFLNSSINSREKYIFLLSSTLLGVLPLLGKYHSTGCKVVLITALIFALLAIVITFAAFWIGYYYTCDQIAIDEKTIRHEELVDKPKSWLHEALIYIQVTRDLIFLVAMLLLLIFGITTMQ